MQNGGHKHYYDPIKTDMLIVGAGAAGLRAAIELAREGVYVLVLGKRRHGDARTVWASGSINGSPGNLDSDDRWQIHAADTIGEGHIVNDPRIVETLAPEAPERILELRDWVCSFSLTDDGSPNQRYFGAHHREDCPEGADAWRKNFPCAKDERGDMHLWTEPIAQVPAAIQRALEEDYGFDYHYLE
jgi:succinate dehydrogenase/fumarate reductase flavoprotein subunit